MNENTLRQGRGVFSFIVVRFCVRWRQDDHATALSVLIMGVPVHFSPLSTSHENPGMKSNVGNDICKLIPSELPGNACGPHEIMSE
jgi:hypothetical protein